MRVLWFSNTPAGGDDILKGVGTRGGWLYSLDKALNTKIDLAVAFYYARYCEPFSYNGVKYFPISKKNWKLNAILNSVFGNFRDKEDIKEYLKIINEVKPEIIHIHGTENPFGCIIGQIELPIILSIQGICVAIEHKYFNGIEKKYANLSAAKLLFLRTWINSKSYKSQYFNNTFKIAKRETVNLKKAKYIIGRTDWDRRLTRILAPWRLYFHNDEVLRESFYKNVWSARDNQKLIIHSTIGDSIFKGLETVCHALSLLIDLKIDIEWRVAGISKNSLMDRTVKRKLKKLYPHKNLLFLGILDEKELINKMLEANIFVMPSHIENSPNSLCEAMILGMPCITTMAGGASSLLNDKEDGIVIQAGDPWSMAGAIMELHENPALAIKYGLNAREKALYRHNPDRIINELLSIYNTVIMENNRTII